LPIDFAFSVVEGGKSEKLKNKTTVRIKEGFLNNGYDTQCLRHNARPALLLGRPSGPLRARATYGEGEAKTTTTNTTKRQQRWLPLTAPTRKRPRRSGGG